MVREDAFSVVDCGAPIVNIGSTGAPVVACARYLGILHFRNTPEPVTPAESLSRAVNTNFYPYSPSSRASRYGI